MALSPDIIDRVNKRLLKPFDELPVRRTDVGVLFGCRSASGTVARDAATLYHQGAFPEIIVAGGMRVFQPAVFLALSKEQRSHAGGLSDFFNISSEARYMRDVLRAFDVPEDAIIMGSEAKKGHLIAADLTKMLMRDYKSATVSAYLSYSRRNVGSLRFQGVNIPLDVRGVKPFGLTPDNWHESKVAGFLVQEELNMDGLNPQGYVGVFTSEVDLEEEARFRGFLPVL